MSHQLEVGGIVDSSDGGHATLYPGPVETQRDIFFVNGAATAASDSTTTNGRNRQKPFASIDYAVTTAAGAGSMVVALAAHRAANATSTYDELLSVSLAAARVSVLGCGAGSTRVTLCTDSANAAVFTFSAAACEVRNFIFGDVSDDTAGWPIQVAAAAAVIGECEFHQANSSRAINLASGSYPLIENCTLTVTRTETSTALLYGVLIANGVNRVHIEGTTFNGGSHGWRAGSTGNGAVHLAVGSTSHGFSSSDCTLVNGASWSFEGTVTGIIAGLSMEAGCRLHSAGAFSFYSSGYLAAAGGGNPMLNEGVWITGVPYWVNNTNSNASNSNNGTQPERPLLTLGQALTNVTAQNGDVILVAAGHDEDVTGVVSSVVYSLTKNDTKIFGFGEAATRPSFRVTPAASGTGDTTLFSLSSAVAGIHIDNIRVLASTYTNGLVTGVAANANHWLELEGISFDQGLYDVYAIRFATANPSICRIKSCDAAPSVYGGAAYGLLAAGDSAASYAILEDCIFDNAEDDDGEVIGWSADAVSFNATGPAWNALTNTMRNGADIVATGYTIVAGTIADAPAGVTA